MNTQTADVAQLYPQLTAKRAREIADDLMNFPELGARLRRYLLEHIQVAADRGNTRFQRRLNTIRGMVNGVLRWKEQEYELARKMDQLSPSAFQHVMQSVLDEPDFKELGYGTSIEMVEVKVSGTKSYLAPRLTITW